MINLDITLQDTIQKLDNAQKMHLLAFIQSLLNDYPQKSTQEKQYLQMSIEERLEKAKSSFGTIANPNHLTLEDLRRENIYGDEEI